MIKTLVLASNNKHKIAEFKQMFSGVKILTLNDIGFFDDVEETGETFKGNALIKAQTINDYLSKKGLRFYVIADDSGLCVEALGGAPGVYSARYSGVHGNNKANRDLLLKNLETKTNRNAYFYCGIIFLKPSGEYLYAEGKIFGEITQKEIGDESFGYDCLFFSKELNKTFGQATADEKNSVSHRGRAIQNLMQILDNKSYFEK